MKKLIAVLVFILLPLGMFAQGTGAYVYTQEIMAVMPEVKDMQTKLQGLNEDYRKEFTQMEEEFKKKYSDFVAQQDSLTENIKLRRMQELQDMETRMQNLMQVAQEDIDKKQQEWLQPIQQKVRDAIKQVGDEKGYTYIIDPSVMLYLSTNMTDATPFVKQKLGL